MQAVGEAASGHDAPRELIDDDDLAVLDDVVAVAFHERLGAQRRHEAVGVLDVLRRVEVLHADHLLDLRHGAICRRDRLLLLVDLVVRTLLERRDGMCHLDIDVRRLLAGAGDDERRARLIDEDGVHLIDDGIVERALHHLALVDDHVVAQVVETELIVRAERHVAAVGELAFGEIHVVGDEPDGEAEEAIEPPHPLAVALREVVIDRDHVDALARERVEVDGQGRDERLALARAHLGDASVVQTHAADELDIEVAHAEHAARALAHDGKGLRQQVVERLARRQPLLELRRHADELVIRQPLHLRLERIDAVDDRPVFRDVFIIIIAQESLDKAQQKEPLLIYLSNYTRPPYRRARVPVSRQIQPGAPFFRAHKAHKTNPFIDFIRQYYRSQSASAKYAPPRKKLPQESSRGRQRERIALSPNHCHEKPSLSYKAY